MDIDTSHSSSANPWSDSFQRNDATESAGHDTATPTPLTVPNPVEQDEQMDDDDDWYVPSTEETRIFVQQSRDSPRNSTIPNESINTEDGESIHVYPPRYASNVSMHADNSPNHKSNHTDPLTHPVSSLRSTSSPEIRDADNAFVEHSSASASQAAAISYEQPTVQSGDSAGSLVEASLDQHIAGASTRLDLPEKIPAGQTIAWSESRDVAQLDQASFQIEQVVVANQSPIMGLESVNDPPITETAQLAAHFVMQEADQHPPGHYESNSSSQGLRNFSFQPTNSVFTALQSRMAARIPIGNWRWSPLKRPSRPTTDLSKVRLITNDTIESAVQRTREAADQIRGTLEKKISDQQLVITLEQVGTLELRQEREALQKKIGDQQVIIDTMKEAITLEFRQEKEMLQKKIGDQQLIIDTTKRAAVLEFQQERETLQKKIGNQQELIEKLRQAAAVEFQQERATLQKSTNDRQVIIDILKDRLRQAERTADLRLQQEKASLQKKISDQQVVVEALKDKLRQAEMTASSVMSETRRTVDAPELIQQQILQIHSRFDLKRRELERQYSAAIDEACSIVHNFGGSRLIAAESPIKNENEDEVQLVSLPLGGPSALRLTSPTQRGYLTTRDIPISQTSRQNSVSSRRSLGLNFNRGSTRPRNLAHTVSRQPSENPDPSNVESNREHTSPQNSVHAMLADSRQTSEAPTTFSERRLNVPIRHYRPSISSRRSLGPSLMAISEEEDLEPARNEPGTDTSQAGQNETAPPDPSRNVRHSNVSVGGFSSGSRRRRDPTHSQLEEEKAKLSRDDKNSFNYRIRELFKTKLKITQDNDFVNHIEADPTDVASFLDRNEPKPDLNNLHFDLMGDSRSLWNNAAFNLLRLEFLKNEETQYYKLPKMSDDYLESLIKDRFTRLKSVWVNAERQIHPDGSLESIEDVEARLIQRRNERLKAARHRERRATKLSSRKRIVEGIIELKTSARSNDLKIWQWLEKMLKYLDVEGMSSEESEEENHRTVYRVKVMTWRRDITEYLDMIDRQRIRMPGLFSRSGSKGVHKVRGQGAGFLTSARDPMRRLPRVLYDNDWFESIGEQRQLMLKVSRTQFEWLRIHGGMH